jgi:FKBP-type peptidyl-prolyl cis-trans isomerase FkpA
MEFGLMTGRRAIFGASALLAGLAVGVMALSSCKDDRTKALPQVKAPTTVKGPTKEEVLAKEANEGEVNAKDFEPIPELGPHTIYKTPDGEVWRRYKNGLMIQVLRVGEHGKPQVGQTVEVAYKGTLPGSNKEFDSKSADDPFKFQLGKKNSVIKGWTLAVSTMKPGGKIKVFIPPDLGYGARGAPGRIPPNSALIFEIELLGVTGNAVVFPTTAPATLPSIDSLQAKPMGPELPETKPAR